ncbi:MAG: sugar phosphate nucleotidyltransferase [Pseudomonadota bacterium]
MTDAVLLAAGLGSRAWPLTARCPKPVLRIGHESVLERHLRRLEGSGHTRTLVTCSYHSSTLRLLAPVRAAVSMRVEFSHEGPTPLETAGGLRRVLSRLNRAPFTLVNGDVWTEAPLGALGAPPPGGIHLLLVPNPPHHPTGDFCLNDDGTVTLPRAGHNTLTYAGIARIDPRFMDTAPDTPRLADIFRSLITTGRLTGQRTDHTWFDVGTVEAFTSLNARKARSGDTQFGQ